MAHWAQIDENNVVIQVIVTDNNDPNGDEGYQWLIDNFGGRWVQTSYNANFRFRFASIGDIYNADLDYFIPPKPHESWVLDTDLADWVSPIEKPREDRFYIWSEDEVNWKVPPSPFASWNLVDDQWIPPIERPEFGNWVWNEESISWEKLDLATPNT